MRSVSWKPDWTALMRAAQAIALPDGPGFVYFVTDSHLGGASSPEFIAMLRGLSEARAVIFLGDLFQVWLALPKYWDAVVLDVLEGFRSLQAAGTRTVFVAGNREFFLPGTAEAVRRSGLPFDSVVPGAAVLTWAGRRYGLTHGDLVNRRDAQYLKWRRLSRSPAFAWLFRAMPGGIARRIAQRLERGLSATNLEIKIQYPLDELEEFAGAVLPGLDGFFIGHFHRDELICVPGQKGALRIVPDWLSRKQVLRMAPDGRVQTLRP